MEINYPPYTITDKMLNLATNIMEKIREALDNGTFKLFRQKYSEKLASKLENNCVI